MFQVVFIGLRRIAWKIWIHNYYILSYHFIISFYYINITFPCIKMHLYINVKRNRMQFWEVSQKICWWTISYLFVHIPNTTTNFNNNIVLNLVWYSSWSWSLICQQQFSFHIPFPDFVLGKKGKLIFPSSNFLMWSLYLVVYQTAIAVFTSMS